MKRILQIVGSMNRAGAETMIMNLYRKLNRQKYQFDFVYFTESKCDYDDEITALGGQIYRIPENKTGNPILRTYHLYKLIKRIKPVHAIHCHQLFSNSMHLTAGYLAGINFRIAHSHNTSDKNSKNPFGQFYQSISKLIIRNISTDFIACGVEAGKFLFPGVKSVLLLPNAIEISDFILDEKPNVQDVLSFPLNNNPLIISQIGRLSEVKNHDFTILLAKHLKKKNLNYKILIIGDGKLKESLITRVEKEELNQNIHFLGIRSDINKLLTISDLLLMPSIHEGFPVILVESQASGTPALISSNITKEVDLGLNLIHFCDLNKEMDEWYNQILLIKNNARPSISKRKEFLRKSGFDINHSVNSLERLYERV